MKDILISKTHSDAWNYLIVRLDNPHAVAGVMGYFQARTGFNTLNGFYPMGEGMSIDRKTFIHDKRPYGIGAWDIWYDKQGWWNLAKRSGYPLTSVEAQLDFFDGQLNGQTYGPLGDALKLSENVLTAAEAMYNLYLGEDHVDECNLDDILDYAHQFYSHFVHPTRTVKYVRVTDEEAWIKTRPMFLGRKIHKAVLGETYPHFATSNNGKWEAIYYEGSIRWILAKSVVVFERKENYGEHLYTVGC